MNREQLDSLIRKWEKYYNPIAYRKHFSDTQYDDRSATINYAFIREYKPKTVVEFGTRKGRVTRDILQALLDNGGEATFKPYEIDDDMRRTAQSSLNQEFGDKSVQIGIDIRKEKPPKDIDYLFVDHSHEDDISSWTYDYLIPNHCKDNCLIQIHDLPLSGDWDIRDNPWNEAKMLKERLDDGRLDLKKVYWTYEEGERWESTWWLYRKSA